MSEPFLSEIKIISWNFAPKGWAFCNGQILPIAQNQALFSLLGTTYGGDGRTTFALPDFRGRIPHHFGNGLTLGERAGSSSVTINSSQLPAHNHLVSANTNPGTLAFPSTLSPAVTHNIWASSSQNPYTGVNPDVAMDPTNISATGGSQPHENRQPYLVLNFIIALQGIFPSQN